MFNCEFGKIYCKILENYIIDDDVEELETVGLDGEYWFDESGNTMYADGDIGDKNHESYVVEQCLGIVLNYFDLNFDEFSTIESYEEEILDTIVDEMELDDEQKYEIRQELENDPASAIIKYLEQKGVEYASDIVLNAYGSTRDAREFAIKAWDWSRVAGDSIETRELTREKLIIIARGISNALDEEGKVYEYSENPDVLDLHEYGISTYSGKRYNITLRDMESGNVEGLERADLEIQKSAATDQLRQMDISQMPSYYQKKGIVGDSYIPDYIRNLKELL